MSEKPDVIEEMDLIYEIEACLRVGNAAAGSPLNISFDGDNKSCEICVSNGNKEIWISSNDVEDYQEE